MSGVICDRRIPADRERVQGGSETSNDVRAADGGLTKRQETVLQVAELKMLRFFVRSDTN